MPSLSPLGGRSSKRSVGKKRASLVVHLDRHPQRLPCLVLDSSPGGFRLRGSFHLRRGQIVEIVLADEPLSAVRCSVAWVGKPGSRYEGEAGLEMMK